MRIVWRDQNEQCTTNKMRSAFAVIWTYHEKTDADAERVRMRNLDFECCLWLFIFSSFSAFDSDVEAQNFWWNIFAVFFCYSFSSHYIRIDWVGKLAQTHRKSVWTQRCVYFRFTMTDWLTQCDRIYGIGETSAQQIRYPFVLRSSKQW